MYRILGCLILLILFVATPLLAQSEEGTIARVISWRAKPGMTQEMEKGLKKHLEWHRKHNDSWTWTTWLTVSGDATEVYGAGTFGHRWADFDRHLKSAGLVHPWGICPHKKRGHVPGPSYSVCPAHGRN